MSPRSDRVAEPAVTIRPERPGDVASIHALTDAAFRNTDDESAIVDRLRGTDRWIADLSLVAEAPDGAVVGHCLTSVGDLVGEDGTVRPILALGPISVLPERQGQGIGGALIRATIAAAVAGRWPAIVLLGHATYYPRFGFERARALGIEPERPWRDENWMALRLPGWTPDLRGTMHFPPEFRIE